MIDEKLDTFLKEGGVLHAESDNEEEYEDECHSVASQQTETVKITSSRREPKDSTPPKKPTKRSMSKVMNTEATVNDEEENSDPKKKKKASQDGNKTKRGKEYMPEFRSGAYAILVTLFHFETENEERKYMLKSEVMRDAQKHCDSSFKSVYFF